MAKLSFKLDNFVYEQDKLNVDTYYKGRFFISIQAVFLFLNIISLPYYFNQTNIALPNSLKAIFIFTVILLATVFYIYPKYGYRVLFVNIHSLFGSATAMYSTYYLSGGLFSPDLGFSTAISIYVFLVANRLSGIIWSVLGILQLCWYYYAAINHQLNFREITLKLSEDYYFYNLIFSVLFGVIIVLLYENMMNKLLQTIRKDKAKLEEYKKEITDSINYAKHIQSAVLPDMVMVKNCFPNSFFLYQPKDIVSGDFYFFYETNETCMIAVADCTGHGVPGAFMSLIGSEKLKEITRHTTSPFEVLQQLNQEIKTTLKQTIHIDSSRDGMDIAFCSLNKKTAVLSYAGANRPLWIARNNKQEIEIIKGTKAAIGGLTSNTQTFEHHEIQLYSKDCFYLFTDGYIDQFGGKQGKKLMTKQLKEKLQIWKSESMKMQHDKLLNFYKEWSGEHEQVDDILIVGITI
jgi:serine phosphatase RsbU (regulator of sigma subunit)